MSPRKQPEPPEPEPQLTTSAEAFAAELDEQIASGEGLLTRQVSRVQEIDDLAAAYYTWNEFNEALIRKRVTGKREANEYIGSVGIFSLGPRTPAEKLVELQNSVREKVRRLKSLQAKLHLYESHQPAQSTEKSVVDRTTIFIVHGRNDLWENKIARYLSAVTGLPVDILHEKPHAGRTLIEKFEDYARTARYVVVILTADDEARSRGSDDLLKPRGRQNVVFELGYFVGALGRGRAALLYDETVERPTDIDGVGYIPLDPRGGWRIELAKELFAAGIAVDPTKAP